MKILATITAESYVASFAIVSKDILNKGINYHAIAAGFMAIMAMIGSEAFTGAITFGIIMVAYALLFYLLITYLARIKFFKSYKNIGDAMYGQWEFEDGENGLVINSNYFNKLFLWKSFSKILLTNKYLILKLGEIHYFHIPIDDGNKDLIVEFHRNISSKIQPNV